MTASPDAILDLSDLEAEFEGVIGAFAIDDAGRTLNWNQHRRFAYCSTFKWIVGAYILQEVDAGRVALNEQLHITRDDIVYYSPVVEKHLEKGSMSIGELCASTIGVSDNAAANILIAKLGGLEAMNAFVRVHGDQVMRFDRPEPFLNENAPDDERDTTSADAMTRLLHHFFTSNALSQVSKVQLFDWMQAANTGLKRIRASMPAGWSAGDKTGTSGNGAANDVAILRSPLETQIFLSVFTNRAVMDNDKSNATIAEVARRVIAAFS